MSYQKNNIQYCRNLIYYMANIKEGGTYSSIDLWLK